MTGFELAAIFGALAFAALVGALIPALIELRRTIAHSGELLAKMNTELPSLIREVRETSENLNALVDHTRDGIEHAAVLLHAVGDLGDTVQRVHDTVRGRNGTLLANLASLVAGFKAASAVIKSRVSKEGGESNGG